MAECGKKLEDYLIDKIAGRSARKVRCKRK
jgi:hypothetical protein